MDQIDLSDNEQTAGLMYVVCSKCREFQEPKPGPLGMVSHGYCPGCFEKEMEKIKAAQKTDYAPFIAAVNAPAHAGAVATSVEPVVGNSGMEDKQ